MRIDDLDEHSLEQLVAIEGKVIHKPGDAGRPDAAAEVAQQHVHLAPAKSGRLACAETAKAKARLRFAKRFYIKQSS